MFCAHVKMFSTMDDPLYCNSVGSYSVNTAIYKSQKENVASALSTRTTLTLQQQNKPVFLGNGLKCCIDLYILINL